MEWLIILLIILTIIIVLIVLNTNKTAPLTITGGGQFEPTPSLRFEYLLKHTPDAFVEKFDDIVKPCPEIMKELFDGSGPYSSYRTKKGGESLLKHIESLANEGEAPFTAADHIIDMAALDQKPLDVEFTQLVSKDRANGYNYDPYYAQSTVYELRNSSMMYQAMFMLPPDATHEPKGAKKYTVIMTIAGDSFVSAVVFLAKLFKNTHIIYYSRQPYCKLDGIEHRGTPFEKEDHSINVDKVDILMIDQRFYLYPKGVDKYMQMEASLIFAHNVIRQIKPRIAALLRSAFPISEIGYVVPAPEKYTTILGKIVILPFGERANSVNQGTIVLTPEEYMADPAPFNYKTLRNYFFPVEIDRIWKSYSIGFYEKYDDTYGTPMGKFNRHPELSSINGLCRCFDCAAMVNLFAWYLYKFNNKNFNAQGLISMFNESYDYSTNLYLLIDYPRAKLEQNSQYKIRVYDDLIFPHGIYRDLSRFELHKKWLKLYENVLYKKYFAKTLEKEEIPKLPSNLQQCNDLNDNIKIVMGKYQYAFEQAEFRAVVVDSNKVIFDELFSRDGTYNQYKETTEGSGCYEFIKSTVDMPELIFSQDDMIYNPNNCKIKTRVPQEVSYAYNLQSPDSSKFLALSLVPNERDVKTRNSLEIRKISQFKSLTHIGRVKLFIADLQALLYLLPREALKLPKGVSEPQYKVLYIGSAPGSQTSILAEKFKNVKFILYDGAKFSDRLFKLSNVELHNKLFTDTEVAMYKGKIHIFISDIRKELNGDFDLTESMVNEDMVMQKEWVYGVSPLLGSMLKFRPPYPHVGSSKDDYKYLGGKVYFQVFPWHQSTEGRLLSTREDILRKDVPFDYTQYDNSSLEHNLKRVWCTYRPGATLKSGKFVEMPELQNFPGFDRCLDCVYLLNVCSQFVEKFYENYTKEAVIYFMRDILFRMNKTLICSCEGKTVNPHGFWPTSTRFQKHRKFIKFWDDFLVYYDGLESSQQSAIYLNKR